MKKVFSLRALFQQGGPGSGHHGHRGRKGQEGGSLPGSGGGSRRKGSSSGGNWSEPKLPSDRNYQPEDTSIEDAMKGYGRGYGMGGGGGGGDYVYDHKETLKELATIMQASSSARHVPSVKSSYAELQEFWEDLDVELSENSDLSPKEKLQIKSLIRQAKQEQVHLRREWGDAIAADYL